MEMIDKIKNCIKTNNLEELNKLVESDMFFAYCSARSICYVAHDCCLSGNVEAFRILAKLFNKPTYRNGPFKFENMEFSDCYLDAIEKNSVEMVKILISIDEVSHSLRNLFSFDNEAWEVYLKR